MSAFAERFAEMRPRILPRAGGGWLAANQPGAPLTLGVTGKTAEEAAERFAVAVAKWSALLDVTDTERRNVVSESSGHTERDQA